MQYLVLPIDTVSDGAVLAVPVSDGSGQLLLPAGSLLTRNILDGLRRRGIDKVAVSESRATQEIHLIHDVNEVQAQVEARMQHLFRHALRAGQINPLLHMVCAYRLKEVV